MMTVQYAELADIESWLELAREVEPLFGPMADDPGFQEGLRQAVTNRTAFCVRAESGGPGETVAGGVVVFPEANEIAWLAVSNKYRGKGFGRALLEFAVSRLNQGQDISVQTFDDSVPEGKAARSLYNALGFEDDKPGGLNPAGIPTVIMRRRG